MLILILIINVCRILYNTVRLKLPLKLMKFRKESYRMGSAISVILFFPQKKYFYRRKIKYFVFVVLKICQISLSKIYSIIDKENYICSKSK